MFHLICFTDTSRSYYYIADDATRTCTTRHHDINKLFETPYRMYSVDSITDLVVRYGQHGTYARILLSLDTCPTSLTIETYPELFI